MAKQKKSEHEFSAQALERKLKSLSDQLDGQWEKWRFERALSWLKRSENEGIRSDHDVQFILLWVALDSLFGRETDILPQENFSAPGETVRVRIPDSVAALLDEDSAGMIWLECYRQREVIANVLKNPYIYNPFWRAIAESRDDLTDAPKIADSRQRFAAENSRVFLLLKENSDSARREIVRIVFKRLGTLRNQLMHGASGHNEDLNRTQVEDGHRLLSALVPRVLRVMMESPGVSRGVVAYPPYGEKDDCLDKKFDVKAFDRYFKRTVGR